MLWTQTKTTCYNCCYHLLVAIHCLRKWFHFIQFDYGEINFMRLQFLANNIKYRNLCVARSRPASMISHRLLFIKTQCIKCMIAFSRGLCVAMLWVVIWESRIINNAKNCFVSTVSTTKRLNKYLTLNVCWKHWIHNRHSQSNAIIDFKPHQIAFEYDE